MMTKALGAYSNKVPEAYLAQVLVQVRRCSSEPVTARGACR
jgi:hypothetical protein